MSGKLIAKKVTPILKSQGVIKAAFFGSFARGEAKKNSDVDFLVKFKNQKSLSDLARLKFMLEAEIGKKIDILTYASIHPYLRKQILKEQQVIYEEKR